VRYYKQRRIKPLGGAVLGNLIRARDRWPKRWSPPDIFIR